MMYQKARSPRRFGTPRAESHYLVKRITTMEQNARYQESLTKLAKELNKPVEQLTELERNEALNRIGLSVLDLDIP